MTRMNGGRGVKSLWDTHNEECSKLATYLRANGRDDPLTGWIAQMEEKKPKTISILRYNDDEEDLVKKNAEMHLEGYREMEMHGQWFRNNFLPSFVLDNA